MHNVIEQITNSIVQLVSLRENLDFSPDNEEFNNIIAEEIETTLIGLTKSLRISAFKLSDGM